MLPILAREEIAAAAPLTASRSESVASEKLEFKTSTWRRIETTRSASSSSTSVICITIDAATVSRDSFRFKFLPARRVDRWRFCWLSIAVVGKDDWVEDSTVDLSCGR